MRMPIKTPETANWLAVLLTLAAAAGGSIAKYSYDVLNGHKFSIGVFFAQFIISIFAGSLVVAIASLYHWEAEVAGAAAGLAGWSGAELIKALEKRFLKKVSNDE